MVEGFYSFTRLRTDYCSFFQAWFPGRSPSPCAHMGSEENSSRAGLGPPSAGLAQARHQQVVRKGGREPGGVDWSYQGKVRVLNLLDTSACAGKKGHVCKQCRF